MPSSGIGRPSHFRIIIFTQPYYATFIERRRSLELLLTIVHNARLYPYPCLQVDPVTTAVELKAAAGAEDLQQSPYFATLAVAGTVKQNNHLFISLLALIELFSHPLFSPTFPSALEILLAYSLSVSQIPSKEKFGRICSGSTTLRNRNQTTHCPKDSEGQEQDFYFYPDCYTQTQTRCNKKVREKFHHREPSCL